MKQHACFRPLLQELPLAWLLATLLTARGTAPPAWAEKPLQAPPPQNMAELVRQYAADEQNVHETFELPASSTGLDRAERLQQQWLKRLQQLDFEPLDHAGRIDYLLLENQIEQALHGIAQRRKRLAEIERLVGFREIILDLEQTRRQMQPMDFAKAAQRLAQLGDAVKQVHERVERALKAKAAADKPGAASLSW